MSACHVPITLSADGSHWSPVLVDKVWARTKAKDIALMSGILQLKGACFFRES